MQRNAAGDHRAPFSAALATLSQGDRTDEGPC
jgi:hypothetical protein